MEGDLRRFNALNIKRLKEIGCYRGRRHYNVGRFFRRCTCCICGVLPAACGVPHGAVQGEREKQREMQQLLAVPCTGPRRRTVGWCCWCCCSQCECASPYLSSLPCSA